MISEYINGDLIAAFNDNKFDAIAHGCNCWHSFGAGIAKSIASQFPEAAIADKQSIRGDKSKLGKYTFTKTVYCEIINAYTQYHYGFGKVNCDYDAIYDVFTLLNATHVGKTIGIPKIGAGLAGGDWDVIQEIINDTTPDIDIIVYVL